VYLEIASHTDAGLVRDHNEDYLASDVDLGLMVLADGMGGYQAGEVASAIAVNTIVAELVDKLKNVPRRKDDHNRGGYHWATVLLEQAIIKANQAIFTAAEEQAQYRGMGTTVVAALFHQDFVSIAHVGDSRLYRLRGNEFKAITSDHSVLQELIDCGFYTPEQARNSPNKNLVTRALGVSDSVNVDIQEQTIAANDMYLLCSDGLNDMLEDGEMQMILLDSFQHQLEEIALNLVSAANNNGGEDNISVLLGRFVADDNLPSQNWWQRVQQWWKKR